MVSTDEPFISINNNRFTYNVIFYRLADLAKYRFVSYFIDEEKRRIGFDFTIDEEADSFKIIKSETKGNYSQSTEIFRIPWVKKTSIEKTINRFRPIKEGKKWVITLIPAFENSVNRIDYLKIKPEVKGIYRYLNDNKIVYIGKGNVRDRLLEPQRKEWQFDTIEYSTIESQDEQFEWENYWIEKFKGENEGFLPSYNLISGKSKK